MDDDDDDNDDGDGDDDCNCLFIAGLSGGLRMQMEKRQTDGGMHGQEDHKHNSRSRH